MPDAVGGRSGPIHIRTRPGNQSLDGIFRLIEVAGERQRLDDVLAAMCAGVATTAAADVVSIYVREDVEGADVFTMRGNIGFPSEAVGRVRLRVGEGIIGFVADRLRPVSVATAARDEHFKYIPGLGEERFPALLAVPVLRGSTAAGVLVLQRGPTAASPGTKWCWPPRWLPSSVTRSSARKSVSARRRGGPTRRVAACGG